MAASKAATLTLRAINRATLARQMLLEREETAVPRALERLVGMQAQWPKHPYIGLWTRLARFAREDLLGLLHDRKVVRATALRGTLHYMTAKDFVALRPAFEPALTRGMLAILRARGATLDVDALTDEARAYFGDEARTFEDVRDHLLGLHPGADERAMGYAVRMQLPLVQVPSDDAWGFPGTPKFADASRWLKKPIAKSAAPDALVLRYLAAFGPATVADVQAWSGLQSLRETVEALRPELVTFRDERRRELFDLPDAPRPPEDAPAPVRFLPEYDNAIVGRSDERMLATEHRPRVFLSALRVRSTFLVDGFVAGAWKITRTKAAAKLVLEPFGALSKKTLTELGREGEALLRFAEKDASKHEVTVARA